MTTGNEPDLYPLQFQVALPPATHAGMSAIAHTINASHQAADYAQLRTVLDSHGLTSTAINGPAVAEPLDGYMLAFDRDLAARGNVAAHVTFHHYYGTGENFTVADYHSVTLLDALMPHLACAQASALPLTKYVLGMLCTIHSLSDDVTARGRACGWQRPARRRHLRAHPARRMPMWTASRGWTSWVSAPSSTCRPCSARLFHRHRHQHVIDVQ